MSDWAFDKGTVDQLKAQEGEHTDAHGPGLAPQCQSLRSRGIGVVRKISRVWQPRGLFVKSRRGSARHRHEPAQQAVDFFGRHRTVEEEPLDEVAMHFAKQ